MSEGFSAACPGSLPILRGPHLLLPRSSERGVFAPRPYSRPFSERALLPPSSELPALFYFAPVHPCPTADPTADLLKVCCLLDLADGLHERIAHEHGNIGARVALGALGKLAEVRGGELVRRVAEVEREHLGARVHVRQRDVDASLKARQPRASQTSSSGPRLRTTGIQHVLALPPADGRIEHPRNVGCSEHKHTRLIVADT